MHHVPVNPGEEWAYRLRDAAPSERVRVQAVRPHKRKPQVEIEFQDGRRAGEVAVVPVGRPRAPWSDVTAYDALMANWERLSRYELTDAESSAAIQVLELLVPQGVGEWTWKPVRDGYRIASLKALAEIVQADVAALLADVDTFTYEGALWTSAEGTVRIAQAAAAAHAIPVLAWVHEDERKCRQHTKHGRPSTTGDKATTPTRTGSSSTTWSTPDLCTNYSASGVATVPSSSMSVSSPQSARCIAWTNSWHARSANSATAVPRPRRMSSGKSTNAIGSRPTRSGHSSSDRLRRQRSRFRSSIAVPGGEEHSDLVKSAASPQEARR